MYKHILLPVEIGGPGDVTAAVANARGLLAEGGKITLLNVFEPVPTYFEPYLPPEVLTKSLEGAKARLKDLAGEHGIDHLAQLTGPVGRSIVDWAEENHADCIVVASHQPAMSDFFLGSTAAWVVRHARCSVLVIR